MKTMQMLISMVAGSASAAYAAVGSHNEGAGVLTYFFIGFFALIIISQLVPAMILFFSMVKGIFFSPEKTSAKVTDISTPFSFTCVAESIKVVCVLNQPVN